MATITERLRAAPGYGLANFRFGKADPTALVQEMIDGQGIPYLSIASGAVGVLRALSIRCGPVGANLRPGEYLTLAAVWLVGGKPVAHGWVLRGH